MDKIDERIFVDEINYTTRIHKKQKDTKINDFLKYISIFSSLNYSALNQISGSGELKSFAKNSVVIHENEKGSALYLIMNGKLKVCRSSQSGKKVIFALLNKYDFFGEMSILDNSEVSADIIAMEDSDLFIIQHNKFRDLLNNHFEIALALMKELTHRIRIADTKIKSLSKGNAEKRVAAVIIELANKSGKIEQNSIEIRKIPHQHDLANMAGTSRETISRTLHTFINRGLIKFDGSNITILDYIKFRTLYL